jgi:hypothetical protein
MKEILYENGGNRLLYDEAFTIYYIVLLIVYKLVTDLKAANSQQGSRKTEIDRGRDSHASISIPILLI